MRINLRPFKSIAVGALLLTGATPLCPQQRESEVQRVRHLSADDQGKWIVAHLKAGMPPSEAFGDLILNRSAVALPVIEASIEEVLRSPNPRSWFTTAVDPTKFIDRAAHAITTAGNEDALKSSNKLIKIDENRFGGLVERTLIQAQSYRNPFTVAYLGLQLGGKMLDDRIMSWAEAELADERPPRRNFGPQTPVKVSELEKALVRMRWAEAFAARLPALPTEQDWWSDPIVSRLKPDRARTLHDDVMRYATADAAKGAKR